MELDRQDFAQWLRTREDKVVGRAAAIRACPMARYLVARLECFVSVYSTYYTLPEGCFALPKWAQLFIAIVDDRGQYLLTGKQCLDLLEVIP